MSDTAQLFVIACVWTLAAAILAYFIPKWPVKIIVVALLVGIPFWELPAGYYNFRKQCLEQVSWRAFEPIPPQESICVENLDSGLYANLTQSGFSRIEVTGGSDDNKRDRASGRVVRTVGKEVKSTFCLGFSNGEFFPWRISRYDLLVTKVGDRRVVGRQGQAIWAGTWWQAAMHPILGNGGMCFEDPLKGLRAIRAGTT
jgi:hypothetical protein